MREFSFYDVQTGFFVGKTFSTDLDHQRSAPRFEQALRDHTPAGCAAIEGLHDHLSQRVDLTDPENPRIVDYQPPQPCADQEWNADTKRWQLSAAASEREAKRQTALARITALRDSQHDLVRALVLDPTNGEARKELQAIDAEIAGLRAPA